MYKIYNWNNRLVAITDDRDEAIEIAKLENGSIGGCWSEEDADAFRAANVRW